MIPIAFLPVKGYGSFSAPGYPFFSLVPAHST